MPLTRYWLLGYALGAVACAPGDDAGPAGAGGRAAIDAAPPSTDVTNADVADVTEADRPAVIDADGRAVIEADSPASADDAPSSPVGYVASDAIILNPDRGFYVTADLATARN